MAEEFSLSVSVDADLSKFRQTLRAELEAAKQQGATVPVNAAGGAAGGTNVVPPGAASATVHPGASPTAQAVAQQAAQSTGGISQLWANYAAARQAGASQAAAQAAARGQFFGAGGFGDGPSPAAAPAAAATAAAAAAAGGPSPLDPGAGFGAAPVPDPGWNFVGQPGPGPGLGRGLNQRQYWRGRSFFTGAYIANAAGRLLDASNQYGQALALSRGDPGALAMADVQNRHDIADAFPVAGRLALSLSEAGSGDETYIKRTLQDANDQNALTQRMRERGEMAQDFRQQGDIAGLRGAAQARRIADYHYESQVYGVRNAQRQASEDTAAEAQKAKSRVDKEYTDRLGVQELQFKTKPNADIWRDAQYRAIDQAATDAGEKQKQLFGPMISAADAVKRGAYRDIAQAVSVTDIVNRGGAAAARLRGNNQPFQAGVVERQAELLAAVTQADPLNRAAVISRGVEELKEYNKTFERNFQTDLMRDRGRSAVLGDLLNRSPYQAKVDTATADYYEDQQKAQALPPDARKAKLGSLRSGFNRQLLLLDQEETDRRELTRYGLRSDRDVAALRADRRPGEAGATSIFRAGELEAKALEKHGDTAEARIRREGTYEELRAYREDYRKGFHSEEIQSLSRTALSGPGTSTENPVEVLKSIDQKLQQLVDKMGVPHAGP